MVAKRSSYLLLNHNPKHQPSPANEKCDKNRAVVLVWWPMVVQPILIVTLFATSSCRKQLMVGLAPCSLGGAISLSEKLLQYY